MKKPNLFSASSYYIRKMRIIAFIALFFAGLQTQAQYIFLSGNTSFSIANSSESQRILKTVWLKLPSAESTLELVLAEGKILNRKISAVASPYFVIENDKVRYRPNMAISIADTLQVFKIKKSETIIAQNTVVEDAAKIDWVILIDEIKALPYEWEKTERVRQVLIEQKTSCSQQTDLIKCLAYDASRLEIINSDNVPAECLAELELMLAVPYRTMIIKR